MLSIFVELDEVKSLELGVMVDFWFEIDDVKNSAAEVEAKINELPVLWFAVTEVIVWVVSDEPLTDTNWAVVVECSRATVDILEPPVECSDVILEELTEICTAEILVDEFSNAVDECKIEEVSEGATIDTKDDEPRISVDTSGLTDPVGANNDDEILETFLDIEEDNDDETETDKESAMDVDVAVNDDVVEDVVVVESISPAVIGLIGWIGNKLRFVVCCCSPVDVDCSLGGIATVPLE